MIKRTVFDTDRVGVANVVENHLTDFNGNKEFGNFRASDDRR